VYMTENDIALFLREAAGRYGRYWRKSARAPGAEHELTEIAISRLCRLGLLVREMQSVRPLPAIARFSLGQTEVRNSQSAEILFLSEPDS